MQSELQYSEVWFLRGKTSKIAQAVGKYLQSKMVLLKKQPGSETHLKIFQPDKLILCQ